MNQKLPKFIKFCLSNNSFYSIFLKLLWPLSEFKHLAMKIMIETITTISSYLKYFKFLHIFELSIFLNYVPDTTMIEDFQHFFVACAACCYQVHIFIIMTTANSTQWSQALIISLQVEFQSDYYKSDQRSINE